MLAWKTCPICTSEFTVHLQDIYLQRQARSVPQHYCMNCESFFHVSDYRESEAQLRDDAAWLSQHPMAGKDELSRELVELGARRVFEAGCGTGDLLLALEAAGASAEGIDPNGIAVEQAAARGVRARTGYFSTLEQPVDAIISIDVMEHLPQPRDFFRQLRDSVVDNGLIVVRVPEIGRNMWHYLKDADRPVGREFPDPFIDNSVHITFFSERGLRLMAEELGATYVGPLPAYCRLFRRA